MKKIWSYILLSIVPLISFLGILWISEILKTSFSQGDSLSIIQRLIQITGFLLLSSLNIFIIIQSLKFVQERDYFILIIFNFLIYTLLSFFKIPFVSIATYFSLYSPLISGIYLGLIVYTKIKK